MFREEIVQTPEEFAAIAHLREWCHDSEVCPICKARAAAYSAAKSSASEN